MKKIFLTALLFMLCVCAMCGCSTATDDPIPTLNVQPSTSTTQPTAPSQQSPDENVSTFQTIHSFVEQFNEIAEDACEFQNYEIRQTDDGYVVSTPEGYSALVRLDPKGEIASFSIRNGTFQQKLTTAQIILEMFYPDNTIPLEKENEINDLKQHISKVKADIQNEIAQNENANLETDAGSFSDLSKKADALLEQINSMREQVED